MLNYHPLPDHAKLSPFLCICEGLNLHITTISAIYNGISRTGS